jgi:hypothetical protein
MEQYEIKWELPEPVLDVKKGTAIVHVDSDDKYYKGNMKSYLLAALDKFVQKYKHLEMDYDHITNVRLLKSKGMELRTIV